MGFLVGFLNVLKENLNASRPSEHPSVREKNVKTFRWNYLCPKRMPESTATFSVEAAGQMYNQTNEVVYVGGNANHNVDLSIEVDRRIRNALSSFRKYALELYDRPSAPLELKIRMLRAEVLETMLYDCVTWTRARATTTRCAEPTTGS